jgi:Mn-dependent DtxR family transcriptional regulator
MRTNESAENYLETILILQKRNGNVRSIDIAHELSFSKPSVSVAMKNFREKGYITITDSGSISLTAEGLKIAEYVYERHQVIATALMALGVDQETAFEDSCKIEHDISDKSFEKIKEYLEKQTTPSSHSGDIDVVLL